MISKIVFVVLLLGSSMGCYAQLKYDRFYELSIQDGPGYHGITHVHLMYEGLLLRTFVGSGKKLESKVEIIRTPFGLDKSMKLIELMNFLNEIDIMNYNYSSDTTDLTAHQYILIRCFDSKNKQMVVFKYNKFDAELDKLIHHLNNFVPKGKQKRYQIYKDWVK